MRSWRPSASTWSWSEGSSAASSATGFATSMPPPNGRCARKARAAPRGLDRPVDCTLESGRRSRGTTWSGSRRPAPRRCRGARGLLTDVEDRLAPEATTRTWPRRATRSADSSRSPGRPVHSPSRRWPSPRRRRPRRGRWWRRPSWRRRPAPRRCTSEVSGRELADARAPSRVRRAFTSVGSEPHDRDAVDHPDVAGIGRASRTEFLQCHARRASRPPGGGRGR